MLKAFIYHAGSRVLFFVCLPNEREAFLFGDVIDGDLFEGAGVALPRFEQIYLQADFDLLGEGALREDGLHLRHHARRHHATLGADGMHLLPYARHDREVLRELGGEDARDAVCVHVLQLRQI